MDINATLEKLGSLHLYGFQRAYRQLVENAGTTTFTADQIVAHLVDAEFDEKYNRKLERLVKLARFKQHASFEQLNYQHARELDKNMMLRLQNCDWIRKSRDILITGPTGVGKSFIACAIGFQACINEYKVMYLTANNLLDRLAYAKADGTYLKFTEAISKCKLLIIDDFGLIF
jgi:DNA replication protein DnaC